MSELNRVWKELTRLTERLREVNARKQADGTPLPPNPHRIPPPRHPRDDLPPEQRAY